MKKTISLLLVIVLCLTLCSCGAAKPDAVVGDFCKAMKSYDLKAMNSCLKDSKELDFGSFDNTYEFLMVYMKSRASHISYRITDTRIQDKTASVTVTFQYTDASQVLMSAFENWFVSALSLAFSGGSEEDISNAFAGAFEEAKEAVSTETAEKTGVFQCEKVDGQWKITQVPEEAGDALTCGMLSVLSQIAEAMAD